MILIVDDKPENIFALKRLLEVNNFDVDTALSGEEALKKVMKNSYSLIILDVQMPGMDGFEVAEAISGFSKTKDIPILFLSAISTDKHFITKGYCSGGIDYVAKPVDPDILLLKVKTFNRLYEQSRELKELHLELKLANDHLEKRVKTRTSAMIAANKELAYQNKEKENRAAELTIANKELVFQNEEKEKRAAELIIANKELAFQNKEKEKRAAELMIANEKLAFHNGEKEKRARELINANRMYSFISQINQTIVHAETEQIVLKEACNIAIDYGKFEMASVTFIDKMSKNAHLVESRNMPKEDEPLFHKIAQNDNGPKAHVLNTRSSFICNDIQNEFELPAWKLYASKRGLQSCMMLPIFRAGDLIGTFNLYASEKYFFDQQEITLLEEAVGDISFAMDVFENERHKKLIEEQLIYNEFRLRQAQAIAHIGSWEEDIATGIKTWSEEVCRIYDIPAQENKQSYESWALFIHPADLDRVMNVVKESQANLDDTTFNYRIIRKDGTIRNIYCQIHFEVNESGAAIGKYGVVHDVTETKAAEEALAQSEANLRLIMDSIPQFISTRNFDGKFLFANKSFAQLQGMTQKELLKKSLSEALTLKEEADYYFKQDQGVILSGKTITNPEHSFTDYKGNKRIFHTLKIPITTAGTNEKAVLGITTEITDQKHAENERAKMMADILQRNKNLEQFSYIVSHNLRAPVANILGIVNVIKTIGIDKEEEDVVTGNLYTAATNLDNVIRDLNHILEVKHELNEKRENIKFSVLLDEIKSSIDNLIRDEQVRIVSDFSKVDEISTVKSYLYSIFFNLITNSIKYRQHSISPVIEIISAKIKNKIRLIFKDNGLGIDTEKMGGQLFGLYKRFHNHVEGKGMGLFMVKTQLETLGGTISIASEINIGTEFTVEFENN